MTGSPRTVLLAASLACAFCAWAEPTALVIEFRNPGTGRYFVTADPAEAASLDMSRGTWVRTGGQFSAWAAASDAAGLQPVCRFYIPSARAHVFTADAAECAANRAQPGWNYEGIA